MDHVKIRQDLKTTPVPMVGPQENLLLLLMGSQTSKQLLNQKMLTNNFLWELVLSKLINLWVLPGGFTQDYGHGEELFSWHHVSITLVQKENWQYTLRQLVNLQSIWWISMETIYLQLVVDLHGDHMLLTFIQTVEAIELKLCWHVVANVLSSNITYSKTKEIVLIALIN